MTDIFSLVPELLPYKLDLVSLPQPILDILTSKLSDTVSVKKRLIQSEREVQFLIEDDGVSPRDEKYLSVENSRLSNENERLNHEIEEYKNSSDHKYFPMKMKTLLSEVIDEFNKVRYIIEEVEGVFNILINEMRTYVLLLHCRYLRINRLLLEKYKDLLNGVSRELNTQCTDGEVLVIHMRNILEDKDRKIGVLKEAVERYTKIFDKINPV